MEKNKKLSKIRRKNAQLYPIYKMFSWDLLFFYSIQFLFYTITKKVTTSEILIINGFFLLFKILGQFPAVTITDFLGKKKSIILGNIMLMICILILIFCPGAISIVISNIFFAIGYDIKLIAESNLLYDSVATKGGSGLYSKLESKGSSLYYVLDGIASLASGYLFVINNYLPMVICLIFIVISTILALGFEDIYKPKKIEKGGHSELKEYGKDLRLAFKFILKSKRMKSFILFSIVFYSLINIIDIYRSNILTDLGLSAEQYSIIFSVLILLGGISVSATKIIEKKFKNRTLTFLSLTYITCCIVVGIISSVYLNIIILPIVIVMFAILKMCTSTWYMFEYKYLKNFTVPSTRNKISSCYEVIQQSITSIFSILGGLLLNILNVENSFLIVGLIGLVGIVISLDYMKTRFGLKPRQYHKSDIKFEIKK